MRIAPETEISILLHPCGVTSMSLGRTLKHCCLGEVTSERVTSERTDGGPFSLMDEISVFIPQSFNNLGLPAASSGHQPSYQKVRVQGCTDALDL